MVVLEVGLFNGYWVAESVFSTLQQNYPYFVAFVVSEPLCIYTFHVQNFLRNIFDHRLQFRNHTSLYYCETNKTEEVHNFFYFKGVAPLNFWYEVENSDSTTAISNTTNNFAR